MIHSRPMLLLLLVWSGCGGAPPATAGDEATAPSLARPAPIRTANHPPRSQVAPPAPAGEQLTHLLGALDAIDIDNAHATRRAQIARLEQVRLSEPRLEEARATCAEAHRAFIRAEVENASARSMLDAVSAEAGGDAYVSPEDNAKIERMVVHAGDLAERAEVQFTRCHALVRSLEADPAFDSM